MQLLPSVRLAPQELLTRTALETHELELMAEVSSLRLKLTAVERDHRDKEVRSSAPAACFMPPTPTPMPMRDPPPPVPVLKSQRCVSLDWMCHVVCRVNFFKGYRMGLNTSCAPASSCFLPEPHPHPPFLPSLRG